MSNIQLLPQFDGNNTSFALSANGWWTDIIYFTQPGFGSPVSVAGCNITSGQNSIAVPSTSMLYPGMTISSLAAGIPLGAYIGVVSLASVTMFTLGGAPLNAIVSNPDMTLTFNPPPLDLTGVNFLCHWRKWRANWLGPINTQMFLKASTADGSLICGGPLGTLQFNVPHTSLRPIPPGKYHADIIAFDGIYTINLFQNAPALVTLSAGISDPSFFHNMIIELTTLPTAGGGAAFASITPAGTLLIEEAAVSSETIGSAAVLTSLTNDFPILGDVLFTNTPVPPTPSTGQTRVYVDSSLKQVSYINDTGTVYNLTGAPTMAQLPVDAVTSALEFVIDGGGAPLLLNQLSPYLIVPTACTIQSVTLLADQTGSVTIDVWMCTYANYQPGTHPVVGDSITASDVPAIASTYKYTDSALTGWTTAIPAGNVMVCNVKVAASSITRVTCVIQVKKT